MKAYQPQDLSEEVKFHAISTSINEIGFAIISTPNKIEKFPHHFTCMGYRFSAIAPITEEEIQLTIATLGTEDWDLVDDPGGYFYKVITD